MWSDSCRECISNITTVLYPAYLWNSRNFLDIIFTRSAELKKMLFWWNTRFGLENYLKTFNIALEFISQPIKVRTSISIWSHNTANGLLSLILYHEFSWESQLRTCKAVFCTVRCCRFDALVECGEARAVESASTPCWAGLALSRCCWKTGKSHSERLCASRKWVFQRCTWNMQQRNWFLQ